MSNTENLYKRPAVVLTVEIMLVVFAVLLCVVDVNCNAFAFKNGMVSVFSAGALVCGLAAWKHLTMRERASCGLFIVLSIRLLFDALRCCGSHSVQTYKSLSFDTSCDGAIIGHRSTSVWSSRLCEAAHKRGSWQPKLGKPQKRGTS